MVKILVKHLLNKNDFPNIFNLINKSLNVIFNLKTSMDYNFKFYEDSKKNFMN